MTAAPRSELLVFSADDWPGVADSLGRLLAGESAAAGSLADLARDLASRPPGPCRLAIIADDAADLLAKSRKARDLLAGGRRRMNVGNRIYADRARNQTAKTAFLFPGFAAQYPNMLPELHARFATARRWFEAQTAEERARWRRNEFLFARPGGGAEDKARIMREASLRQISGASLVVNLSYYNLAQQLGLRCDAMVGHSFGENTALIAAGMVDGYDEVAELLVRITAETADDPAGDSALLAVTAASLERISSAGERPPDLTVALDNCPQQVIVCGDSGDIERLESDISAHKELSFRLPRLSRPVHSATFPVSLERLREFYDELELAPPKIPVWSCASAAPLPSTGPEIRACLAEQWVSTVRFRETARRLYDDGFRTFVEVGPDAKLTAFVRDSLRGRELTLVSMDREGSDKLQQVQSCLALLWVRGHPVRFEGLWDEPAADPPLTAGAARPETAVAAPPAASPVDRDLVHTVLEHIANVLELTDVDMLDPASGFFELGMESLSTVELCRRLERHLGCEVPPTVAFDYPTPERLAGYLESVLSAGRGRSTRTPLDNAAAPARGRPADAHEPLAIVGMACRFPGGAADPEAFWRLLRDGRDAVTSPPPGRWPQGVATTDHARHAACIEDIDLFDAGFFGISPREAEALDPQQRLLLEVVWESLERAGVPPSDHAGRTTGIFVGISTSEYAQRLTARQRLEVGGYLVTGNMLSTAAGRISHVLGTHGPSLAVDTACSSSLVAVHLAAQALRRGECRLAVAGGVGLLLAPESSRYLAAANALSASGRCRTFDAGADGYVRGEGCGMVVLERLADARAAGHPVLAVLRGSAINHDGHTSGLTVPNGLAQESVVELALADAGVAAETVSYVEAHGTGTALGDPIELGALGRVFGAGSERQEPVRIGSVKTNIGHLEAAAGIAGLIKVVLQLQRRELAPSLWFESPNPRINWSGLPLKVCDRRRPWTAAEPLRAGVSSFGISGTNAHVIVEEAPPPLPAEAELPAREHSLVLLSARDGRALTDSATRLADHLETTPSLDLADVAYTSQVGRRHLRRRASLVARSSDDAVARLRRLAERVADRPSATGRRRLAFLFTGQGSQQALMGHELLASEPAFKQAIEACDQFLRPRRGSLLDVLAEPKGAGPHPLDTTAWAQPALFAVGYGLAELWRSWGVEPDAVLGHSVGEITAAAVSGVLALEDALELVTARGELMQSSPAGAMLAVAENPDRVLAALGPELGAALDLAAINGPRSCVLSGPQETIEEAVERLGAAGLPARRLDVGHAFHSRSMDPILGSFGRLAGRFPHRQPRRTLVSNVTGAAVDEIADPAEHWTRHLRHTVRFADGIDALRDAGCDVFLELGPRPVLIGLAQQSGDLSTAAYLASLHPPHAAEAQLLESLGRLFELGFDIDWQGFARGRGGQLSRLPTYPFQRERFWIEPVDEEPSRAVARVYTASASLLGERLLLPDSPSNSRFEAVLSTGSLGFLSQHRVAGRVSLPISAFLDALFRLGEALKPDCRWQIERFVAHTALALADDASWVLHTVVEPLEEGGHHCRFFGRDASERNHPWLLHAEADLRPAAASPDETPSPRDAGFVEEGDGAFVVDGEQFYASCRQAGFDHGPAFQVLRQLTLGRCRAWGIVDEAVPGEFERQDGRRLLRLEAALQAVGALVGSREDTAGMLMREVGRVTLGGELGQVAAMGVLAPDDEASPGEALAEVALVDVATGDVVGEISGIRYVTAPQPVAAPTEEVRGPRPRESLLSSIANGEGEAAVADYLRELACEILRFPPDRSLDTRQPLPEMGLDSIMAVWFGNRLESDLAVTLEPADFLREPTLEYLTTLVIECLRRPAATPEGPDWVEGVL